MGLKCRLPSTLRREPRRDPSMGQGEGGSFSFLGTAASAASVRAGEDLVLTPQEKREGAWDRLAVGQTRPLQRPRRTRKGPRVVLNQRGYRKNVGNVPSSVALVL